MKLPVAVRERFRRWGRRGGRARAGRLPPQARSAVARRAALRRWVRERFGAASFARLGLPGGAAADRGLDDLADGRESCESLVVSLAAPRLRREGVPLPPTVLEDPERRLYRRLLASDGPLAHARYLAWLREIASFADACPRTRREARRAR